MNSFDLEKRVKFLKESKRPPVIPNKNCYKTGEALRSVINSMPHLNARETQRRRKKLHLCILDELKEDNLPESLELFEIIVERNEYYLRTDDVGTAEDLQKNKPYLEFIDNGLRCAEMESRNGDIVKQAENFLKIALKFSNARTGFLWLAEMFFELSINKAKLSFADDMKLYTCSTYLYGKYISNKWKKYEKCISLLDDARSYSCGKVWTLSSFMITDEDDYNVYKNISILLFNILLLLAKQTSSTDMFKAQRLVRLALRRALDVGKPTMIAIANVEMGKCCVSIHDFSNAIIYLEEALDIYRETENIEGICWSKKHLSRAYLSHGDEETAAKLLTSMGKLSVKFGLKKELAQALHFLGVLHLENERPLQAEPHLSEAFMIARDQGIENLANTFLSNLSSQILCTQREVVEREEKVIKSAETSRMLHCIASGQVLMEKYFIAIGAALNCYVVQSKIWNWQDSGIGFWINDDRDELIPCSCPAHGRTNVDILRMKNERTESYQRPRRAASRYYINTSSLIY